MSKFYYIKELWVHLTNRRKKQVIFLTILMIIVSLLEMITIGAVVPFLGALMSPEKIYNHYLSTPLITLLKLTNPSQLLLPLTIIFIFFAVFSATTRLILLWAQTRISYAIGADLGILIFNRTLHQPYSVHLNRNSSEVIASISNKTSIVINGVLLPCLFILSSSLILINVVIILIIIDFKLAATGIFLFGFIYGSIVLATKRKLSEEGEKVSVGSIKIIKILQEGLGGIRDVLVNGSQSVFNNIFANAEVKLRRSQANIGVIGASPRYIIEGLGMVIISLIAFIFANKDQGIINVIPILGSFALGVQRSLPVVQLIFNSWATLRGSLASLRDVVILLNQPLPDNQIDYLNKNLVFKKAISYKNIGFHYKKDKWVLRNINLEIKKGTCLGIIGLTGSGKSTLLDITMSLLQPNEGMITIDGIAITKKNYRYWQNLISHVPQSIFLADTTIRENIAFGIPLDLIDENRIIMAARKAKLDNFIESLDEKYDTIVGERGVQLSGGQRQRIGIARALYKNTEVLILDEATSALDEKTEESIINSINKLDKYITVIIVTHRISSLKYCNEIIEIKNNKIITHKNIKN